MDAVRSLVAQVSSAKDEGVPHLLLRLREALNNSRLESKELDSAFRLMWLSDLIHVMAGVTRKDFSRLVGGWNTAAQLAEFLATVCSGLRPQEPPKKAAEAGGGDDDVTDYYEKLLPTAVDSLLILANSLLEHTTTSTGPKSHVQCSSSVFQVFQSVLISLSRLCSSHRQCAFKAIQSPYILSMMTSSRPHYCLALVKTLNHMVKMDQLLRTAGQPHSVMDVVAHRLTSSDNEELQVECMKLLAAFISTDSGALNTLCSKYTALTSVVVRFEKYGLGEEVDLLVRRLGVLASLSEMDRDKELSGFESQTAGVQRELTPTTVRATTHLSTESAPSNGHQSRPVDVAGVHHSATVIQACWRGYAERKLLERMRAGCFQSQSQDMGNEQEEFDGRSEKMAEVTKKLQSLSEMRTFHEKQLLLLEQLSASEVTSFLNNQQTSAATKIQLWWRKLRDKENVKQKPELLDAVVVIQRAVRKFLKRKKQLSVPVYPAVEGKEREDLQREIVRYHEEYPPLEFSEVQVRQTHDEVQQLLCEFYSRIRNEASEAERKRLFLSKLEHDCALLLAAPRLSEVSDEVVERFLSGSQAIATMALQAHYEELKASELPWWKLPPSSTEGELMQLLN